MSSISKPDHCTERPSLVLPSAYREYLKTFKLMTPQVVQRARPLITRIGVIGPQNEEKNQEIKNEEKPEKRSTGTRKQWQDILRVVERRHEPLGVANGPSITVGLAKVSSNFMGQAVSVFSGYVRLAVSILDKVVLESQFYPTLKKSRSPDVFLVGFSNNV